MIDEISLVDCARAQAAVPSDALRVSSGRVGVVARVAWWPEQAQSDGEPRVLDNAPMDAEAPCTAENAVGFEHAEDDTVFAMIAMAIATATKPRLQRAVRPRGHP